MHAQPFVATLIACAGAAHAIIIHPQDEPFAGAQPSPAVIGRWSTNASLVAVGPNHAITTRHQGGGVGTPVSFAGVQYIVAQEIPHPSADLRIVRLVTPAGASANLTQWAPLYAGTDEQGQIATGSGYGEGRGPTIFQGAVPIGYMWAGAATRDLRSGRNTIDATTVVSTAGFTSNALIADFDPRPGATSVQYEATLAEGDSGGGWFLLQSGVWKVAGIGLAVENVGQAIFSPPEQMVFVRLSSYAAFIQANLPQACYPNCDSSTIAPILNVADFTCFLQRFAAQDPYANCDASTTTPVLNVADFTCFLQRFATGCP
jgi:hypothetical protein